MDEWRVIPGFDGFYKMNREGQIMSCRCRGHQKNRRGTFKEIYGARFHITLIKDGRERTYSKHKLLCMTFPEEYHRSSHGQKRPIDKVDSEGHVVKQYDTKRAAADDNHVSRAGLDYHIRSGEPIYCADGVFTFREAPWDRFKGDYCNDQ